MEYKSKILKWITLFVFALSVFLVNKIDANASDVPELQWKDGYIYWDEVHTRNNSSTVWFSVSKWEVSVIIDGVTYSGSIPYNSWNYNVTKTVGTKTTKYVYACKISEETFCTYLKNSSGTVLTPTQLENAYSSYILFNAVTIVHKADDMSTIYNENGQTEFRRADWLDGAACGWSFGHPPDTTLKTGGYWGMEVKVVKNENIKYTLTVNGTNTSEVWIKNSSGTKVATGTTSTSYRDKVNTVVSYGATALKGYHFGTSGTSTKSVSSYTITKTDTKSFSADANVLTVTYNANGGTGSIGNTTISYGTTDCTLTSSQPTKEHYLFVGWNTKADGTGTWIYPTATEGCLDVGIKAKAEEWSYALGASIYEHSDNSVTLYAQWTPKTTAVTFNKNDGSGDTASQSFAYENSINRFGYKTDGTLMWGNSGQFGAWDRTGYTLLGWSDYSTATSKMYDIYSWVSDEWIIAKYSSVDIYAVWQPHTLEITYNANGGSFGSGATTTQTIKYDESTSLSYSKPSRPGYTFVGWTASSSWNESHTKYTDSSTAQTAQNWAQSFDIQDDDLDNNSVCIDSANDTVTLYAQWEKTNTYTIHYLTSNGTQASRSFSVTFRNDATSANILGFTNGTTYVFNSGTSDTNIKNETTKISYFSDSKVSKNGYSDWQECGISTSASSSATNKKTASIIVSASDAKTVNYYCSYERTPVITLYDYGDNKLITKTINGKITVNGREYKCAGMKYNGTVDRIPVFTFPELNEMSYAEKTSFGTKKNEPWDAEGWSLDKIAGRKSYTSGEKISSPENTKSRTAFVSADGNTTMLSYKDYTYYGNYSKDVDLICDANGGVVKSEYASLYSLRSGNTKTISYERYANINSSTPTVSSKSYILPTAEYKGENGLDKYCQGSWVFGKGQTNTDFYNEIIGENLNNRTGTFKYTPLVDETLYASWTNKTAQTNYEPKVTVTKKAEWANPSSADSSIDFDAEGDIDIDGIVKVTLTAKVEIPTGCKINNLSIIDYYDTEIWELMYSDLNPDYLKTGKPVWTITNGDSKTSKTYTCTYYLKLKERYWTVTPDGEEVKDETRYYINPIEDLTKYKATINSDGTFNHATDYYTTTEGLTAYTYALYGIVYDGGTELDGTQRYVPYSTSASVVMMDHVHWKPTVNQVIISSNINNIYKDISASYGNTYFVQYDTHSTNNSKNSLFNITINSSLKRSYSYYQITNNLFDIKTASKLEQVFNNSIGINGSSSAIFKNTTSADLDKINGYRAGTLLNLASAKNLHTKVNTGGLQYPYGALTSQNTMYATNQNGLKLSIYPFVRTTCTDHNKVFETTRDTSELANKRLDIVIDATNPIITPDSRIKTESESGQQWTVSDGYVDINLVDSVKDPTATKQTLTFKFNDIVSGINDPRLPNDWINAIKDNVQVTLVNVDSGKTVFDYSKNAYGSIIAVKYDKANTMNKTGSVSITLDPSNDDLLGHLQFTIKVIDNVGNWETKTYDIYSFCLTGNVNAVDTLPSASERNEAEIWNGEQGKIQISANGWVDRVKVDFEYSLVQASKKELTKRNNITGDEYKINGDYPYDDSGYTYLPKEYLKCKWGYLSGEIGGMPLSLTELETTEYTLNNSILNAHLDELIANYVASETGGYVPNVNGSNYAIYGTTLYTYPIYSGDTMKSYLDSYTLNGAVIMNEKPYPVNVIINGSKYATINYTETEEGYKASIEAKTIFESEWVKVGNEYLRPLEHYFYMPTYAEERLGKNEKDYYIVQLTAYKDSGTDFVHSVSIQLRMTNKDNPGIRDLQTNIKDN